MRNIRGKRSHSEHLLGCYVTLNEAAVWGLRQSRTVLKMEYQPGSPVSERVKISDLPKLNCLAVCEMALMFEKIPLVL